jgi:hypothetical protein
MWLNEKGQTIAELPESLRLCSKCLMLFNDAREAKLHAANCHPRFIQTKPITANLSVAHVTPDSPPFERRICERMAKISYMVCGWNAPVLRHRHWLTSRFSAQAFLLLKNSSIVSYAAVYTRPVNYVHEQTIADMYTVQAQRRKSYMTILYTEIMKHFGDRWMDFDEPYTLDGLEFIDHTP